MYEYICYFCQKLRNANTSFCRSCGFDSPYGSERFWRYLKKGTLIELGTGYGATSLFAALKGIEVYTVDNGSDGHKQPIHNLIHNIEFDIYNNHFWIPPKKADVLLVDINTDTKEVVDFYSKFVKINGLIIIDGEYANCHHRQ